MICKFPELHGGYLAPHGCQRSKCSMCRAIIQHEIIQGCMILCWFCAGVTKPKCGQHCHEITCDDRQTPKL